MNKTEKILKQKMLDCDVASFKNAAQMAGIDYQTLLTRLKNPGMFRLYELLSLANVLRLTDEDLIAIFKGE